MNGLISSKKNKNNEINKMYRCSHFKWSFSIIRVKVMFLVCCVLHANVCLLFAYIDVDEVDPHKKRTTKQNNLNT